MASPSVLQDLLARASLHFNEARPFIPMYLHLVVSALFPIYAGAHASLSRPSSAAKPDKTTKRSKDEEDEDEEKVQKMEGMSNTDAIVLPVTAGIVLAGLYFLIMKYGADIINLIMGYYFSVIGVYSVYRLINDTSNVLFSVLFPTYFADGGTLWQIITSERKVMPYGGDYGATADVPIPVSLKRIPLPQRLRDGFWWIRRNIKQKYTINAFITGILELSMKVTPINILSALVGLGTIIYVNTISKVWFLTNLQGFAVSYSALQLMSPTTFATGSLILGALFCYDVWAVFFTPLMVTVAKNLDVPIKLVFPRPDEPSEKPGEPPVKSFSMLGLGDIVLPGIMIGLALRFDLYMFYLRKQTKATKTSKSSSSGEASINEIVAKVPFVAPTGRWGDRLWTSRLPKASLPPQLQTSFPKRYFIASMIGYVIGMLTTLGVMSIFQHAQPALLYLVPGVLISLWGTAMVRGEVKEMWEFSEAVTAEQMDEEAEKQKAGEGNEAEEKKDENTMGLFERLWHEIWHDGKKAEDTAKEKDDSTNISSKPASPKSKTDADSKRTKKDVQTDDLLFSFSVSRYQPSRASASNPKRSGSKPEAKVADGQSSSASRSSEDAVMVSSADLENSTESGSPPRYRTRSTRSAVGEGHR